MIQCPMCASAWRTGQIRCECGYDSTGLAGLDRERQVWRRGRTAAIATWLVGFAVLMIVPSVSIGLAAVVGGLLTSAGFPVGAMAHLRVRALHRRLRAAQTPKALPEARVV